MHITYHRDPIHRKGREFRCLDVSMITIHLQKKMPGPSLFAQYQNLGMFKSASIHAIWPKDEADSLDSKASSGMDPDTKGLFHNLLSIIGLQRIIRRQVTPSQQLYIEGRPQSPVFTPNEDHLVKTTSSPTKSLASQVYLEKVGAGIATGPNEAVNETSGSPAKSHVEFKSVPPSHQASQRLDAEIKSQEAQLETTSGILLQQGSAHDKQIPVASAPHDLTKTSVATLQSLVTVTSNVKTVSDVPAAHSRQDSYKDAFGGPATFGEASTAPSSLYLSKVASSGKKRFGQASIAYKRVRASTTASNELHSFGGASRLPSGLESPDVGSEGGHRSQQSRQEGFKERLLGSIMITSTQPDAATIRDYNKFVPLLHEMIQDATKGLRSPSHNRFVIELYIARHVDRASSVLTPHIIIRCQSDERQSQIEQAINSIASKKIIQKYGFPIEVVVSAPLGTVEFRAFFSVNSDLIRRFENMDTLKRDTVRTTLDMIDQSVCGAQMLIQGSATQSHARNWATLGGIILVHGKPYGLTVAHSLVAVAEGGTKYDAV